MAAEPNVVGAHPRDYIEAIVASVIEAIPTLRELHASAALDVVEFFSHERPQSSPQWFHFDTAEYARFNAPGLRRVHNPSYSAILYLSEEEEAHFALLGARSNCSSPMGDEAVENSICAEDALATPIPSRLRHALLVRPRAGRVILLDGAQLHGTLPGRQLSHARSLLGLCFFRRRPSLPPESELGTPQGVRAMAPEFALSASLRGRVGTGMGTVTVAASVDAIGVALVPAQAGWASERGARPQLTTNVSNGGSTLRMFSAEEIASLHAAAAGHHLSADAPAGKPSATPPTTPPAWAVSTGTRWKGIDLSAVVQSAQDTPIQIKIQRQPITRTLRLPPTATLTAECDVCAVELDPPLSLLDGKL